MHNSVTSKKLCYFCLKKIFYKFRQKKIKIQENIGQEKSKTLFPVPQPPPREPRKIQNPLLNHHQIINLCPPPTDTHTHTHTHHTQMHSFITRKTPVSHPYKLFLRCYTGYLKHRYKYSIAVKWNLFTQSPPTRLPTFTRINTSTHYPLTPSHP